MRVRLANRNRAAFPAAFEAMRGAEIERRIRLRYSLSEELAILRQREEKPSEFAAYHAYAEECKRAVQREVEER